MSVVAYASEIFFPVTGNDSQLITDTDGARRKGALVCKTAAGDISVIDASGKTRVYPIALGEVTPFIVSRLNSTGTTATGLWLLAQ